MKFNIQRPLLLLIALYITLIFYDYVNYNSFKWGENAIQTIFLVVFIEFFMWLSTPKKETTSKK